MLAGFIILLSCQLIGELIVRGLDLPFPSPVVGMVLLLLGLIVYGRVPDGLRQVSEGLLKHLALLFVPAGVGLMVHFQLIAQDWLSILLALLLSSVLAILASAWIMRRQLGSQQEER